MAKRTGNPAKFDRCVKAVKKRGGAANAYAVCTAAGTRKNPLPPVWEIEDLQDGNWQFIASVRAGSAKEAVSVYRRDHAGWTKGRKLRARRRNSNPAAESIEAYRDFHGQDPKEMVSVTTKVHFHKHLAAAGELKFLIVDTLDGKYRVTIRFKKDVLLAFNEKRNQLFVEGGDQSVNLKDFGIDPEDAHELETLGKATRIGYFTEKVHLAKEDGGVAIYDHKFRMTNENGKHVTVRVAKYPDVIYRVLDEHLEFSGGSYKILSEGIDQ